jgi:hypothetical protein
MFRPKQKKPRAHAWESLPLGKLLLEGAVLIAYVPYGCQAVYGHCDLNSHI